MNAGKATFYAETLLRRGGRLLAPVNRQVRASFHAAPLPPFPSEVISKSTCAPPLTRLQDDYWLKQEYRAYNDRAQVVWRAGEVGAWDVVFQPKKLLYTKNSTAPQKFHGI